MTSTKTTMNNNDYSDNNNNNAITIDPLQYCKRVNQYIKKFIYLPL